jgi:plastocyanin
MTVPKRVDDSSATDCRPCRLTIRASAARAIAVGLVLIAFSTPAPAQDAAAAPIPKAGWSLFAVDSQEAGTPASNAFDGDPATIWATEWMVKTPRPPHDLEIDMGAVYSINGVRALPRQDGSSLGRIAGFQVLSSLDGVTWTVAVGAGTWMNSGAEQEARFTFRAARYVWLRALAEVDGQPWTTLAELTVWGVVPPSGTGVISQTGWSVLAVDSQEAGTPARNAFDADPATIWATEWMAKAPRPPHDLEIDMGAIYSIDGIRVLPRQDGSSLGRIARFQVLSSLDGTTWTLAVGAGAWMNTGALQEARFAARAARYVWLRALAEVDAQPWTTLAELTVLGVATPSPIGVISQTGWQLLAVDSQETNYPATNAFDGNPSTVWATEWVASSPLPPHDLQIDLGAVYGVSGVRALPRQDGSANGSIAQYQIFVSRDGVTWGPPVASGTWTATAAEHQVLFPATTGRYLWLRALTEVAGQPWTVLAELNVIATATGQPPNGVISLPPADVTIAPGQSVTFSGSGTDPDGQLPLSYAWTFGGGSPASSASQTLGVTFPTAGVFNVALTVSDGAGMPDPTPAVRTITVQQAPPAPPIRMLVFKVSVDDAIVTGYVLKIYRAGDDPAVAGPSAITDLNRPAVIDKLCTVDISAVIAALPPGSYVATVTSVAAGGTGQSIASDPFTREPW